MRIDRFLNTRKPLLQIFVLVCLRFVTGVKMMSSLKTSSEKTFRSVASATCFYIVTALSNTKIWQHFTDNFLLQSCRHLFIPNPMHSSYSLKWAIKQRNAPQTKTKLARWNWWCEKWRELYYHTNQTNFEWITPEVTEQECFHVIEKVYFHVCGVYENMHRLIFAVTSSLFWRIKALIRNSMYDQ